MGSEKQNSETKPAKSEQEAKKSERKLQWEGAVAFVQHLKNESLKSWKLDEGIENILIALRAYGIRTSTSCWAHPEHIKGEIKRIGNNRTLNFPTFPYINTDIDPNLSDREKEEERRRCYQKLDQLLKEFYKNRLNVPEDVYIILKAHWQYDLGPELMCRARQRFNDAELHRLMKLSQKELQDKIISYQREFDDFADFLKDKFLAS